MVPSAHPTLGAALLIVIAILAALIAVATPFALSMRLSERTAIGRAAARRAGLAAEAARDLAIARVLEQHPDVLRTKEVAEKTLADAAEDWSDPAALRVALSDLPGGEPFRVADGKGTILAAEIEDEQGKIDLNDASAELLGNLFGVATLTADIDMAARDIPIDDASALYHDDDPETIDGLVLVGAELVTYRGIENNVLRNCDRGVFFSATAPEDLAHPKGTLVRDARGLKVALTPFWAELGAYSPFKTVTSVREVASWQLVDVYIASLFRRGYTLDDLRELGLGGDALRASGGGRAIDAELARKRAEEGATPTAQPDPRLDAKMNPDAAKGDVDGVLRRLGRAAGKQWLQKAMSEIGGGDARASQYVAQLRARLAERDAFDRRYFRDAAKLAEKLRDSRDIEVLSAREVEALRPYVTVSSGAACEWAGGALIRTDIAPDPTITTSDFLIGVDIPLALAGSVARLEGADGSLEYRRISSHNRRGYNVSLYPQLTGVYPGGTARLFVRPRRPVNINTAPFRVLRALFTGVGNGGDFGPDGPPYLLPKEAEMLARRVLAQPVKCAQDWEALLNAAVAAREIRDVGYAALVNMAVDPGAGQRTTAPIVFRSTGTYTIESTGIVNDRAGTELARRTVRDVVAVSPAREAVLSLDSQADFWYEAGRIEKITGRRGNLVETFPRAIRSRDPQQPLIRYPDRSHEPAAAPAGPEMRAKTGECPDGAKGAIVEHYREELEGHDLTKGGTESLPPPPSIPDPYNPPGNVATALTALGAMLPVWPRPVVGPAFFEMWVQPTWAGGRHVIFDGGAGDFTDRIVLYADQGQLVLRVCDGTLPGKVGDPSLDASEIRAPWAPKPGTWVHVAACWRGTKAGERALFLDGLPVGDDPAVSHLAATCPSASASVLLDRPLPRGAPAMGALQVGTEVIEYEGYTGGTSVRVVALPSNPATPSGRGARGSEARDHAPGTDVQVWGYTNFPLPEINPPAALAAVLLRPNPLQTTRPDGSLWRGGSKLLQAVPQATPCAVVRVGLGQFISATATAIPVYVCPGVGGAPAYRSLAEAGFPPRGFIQIEHELAYYEAIGPQGFVNVHRFLNGRLGLPDAYSPPPTVVNPLEVLKRPDAYWGYELVELASIEVADASDYPDCWWLELDDEWLHYYKATAIDWAAANPGSGFDPLALGAKNVLVTASLPAQVRAGEYQALPKRDAQTYDGNARGTEDWRKYEGVLSRMQAGVAGGGGGTIPPWALALWAAQYDPQTSQLHLALDGVRALSGRPVQAHAAGADARLVYGVTRPYSGEADVVTLVDALQTTPRRATMTVHHAGEGPLKLIVSLPAGGGPMPGVPGRPGRSGVIAVPPIPTFLVSFDQFPIAGRSFFPEQGLRILKHPSGSLPLEVPQGLTVGGRGVMTELPSAEADGPLAGHMDEMRLEADPRAATWGGDDVIPGAGGLHPALRGFRPMLAPATPRRRLPDGTVIPRQPPPMGILPPDATRMPFYGLGRGGANAINARGDLVSVDGELMGFARATAGSSSQTGTNAPGGTGQQGGGASSPGSVDVIHRGLLASAAVGHSDEALFYELPFPPFARLSGGLAGGSGDVVPVTGMTGSFSPAGYLAIDLHQGRGVAELLPYVVYANGGFTRPRDDRGRGAFRGSFGTTESPLAEGDIVFGFPFRYHDRYNAGIESEQGVFWETAWEPPGAGEGAPCLFRAVQWDDARPNGDVMVRVLVRMDARPAWDEAPTNRPGGVYVFDDGKKDNPIEAVGRQVEVRVVLGQKPGAFLRGTWKETARVKAIRVRYVAPTTVLQSVEVDR